jgi:hypothetical protein
MPTTWNPSDKTTTATLSNGDLTVAFSGTGAGGVRSVYAASSGKWYWEVKFVSGTTPGIGIANATATLSTVWTTPTNAAVAYNASIYINNVSQGIAFSLVAGTTVCIALDVGAKLIWFRSGAAGNWNNSGTANPGTGTGGLNITVLGSSLYALGATGSTGTARFDADFGATAFLGTPPSGFTAGFGPATPPPLQSAVSVIT